MSGGGGGGCFQSEFTCTFFVSMQVINFFFNLLVERSNQQGKVKVHAFNSFFYPKLIKSGYASLRRWTKKVRWFTVKQLYLLVWEQRCSSTWKVLLLFWTLLWLAEKWHHWLHQSFVKKALWSLIGHQTNLAGMSWKCSIIGKSCHVNTKLRTCFCMAYPGFQRYSVFSQVRDQTEKVHRQ